MSGYVIWRTDQGKGWVTRPGSGRSYTRQLQNARVFDTREQADREKCPDNEIVQTVAEAMGR